MKATDARQLALEVVSTVRERAAFSREVMDARSRQSSLAQSDRAFATRLAYGVIQTRGTLEEAIRRHLTARKLEPRVSDALCIATYELLFSETEPRAAVHQGVELVRTIRPQAAALANAVLRRLSEEAASFPWGDPSADVAALARLHGHPEWLARMWIQQLGRDAAARIMAANNEPAPLYVATNPFVATPEEAHALLRADGAEPVPCGQSGCFRADDASRAVNGAAIRSGSVIVCDAAAQCVTGLVRAMPGGRLVEVGSGRGTKTILLQAGAYSRGGLAQITAVDSHAFKADILARRLAELRVSGVSLAVGDARNIVAIPGIPAAQSVDAVLVDAPCSGLGTLRRHPEKRWRVTEDDVRVLSSLGLRLLEQSAHLVRPGGFVVYSTCTIAAQENAAVVESFLAGEHGHGFRTDTLVDDVPSEMRCFLTDQGYFASHPAFGGPDGHFAARLVRGDAHA